jgi:peptide/nickel transport system substrate-binding protein
VLARPPIVVPLPLGLTTTADGPSPRADPALAMVEQRGYPKYPFDVSRAQQLLAEAGWTRGPDGLLRSATEDRFSILVSATGVGNSPEAREALVLSDQWKAAGLDANPYLIDEDASNRDELRATVKGGSLRSPRLEPSSAFEIYTTSQIASQQTRWRGGNRMGYSNPEFDKLYVEWSVTLAPARRRDIVVELARFAAQEVFYLPIYYGFDVMAYRNGVRNVTNTTTLQQIVAWNIATWEVD